MERRSSPQDSFKGDIPSIHVKSKLCQSKTMVFLKTASALEGSEARHTCLLREAPYSNTASKAEREPPKEGNCELFWLRRLGYQRDTLNLSEKNNSPRLAFIMAFIKGPGIRISS